MKTAVQVTSAPSWDCMASWLFELLLRGWVERTDVLIDQPPESVSHN